VSLGMCKTAARRVVWSGVRVVGGGAQVGVASLDGARTAAPSIGGVARVSLPALLLLRGTRTQSK
jgi:hypothetical protein